MVTIDNNLEKIENKSEKNFGIHATLGFGFFTFCYLSREAQLFVGWVSGSVTHAGFGFHASTVRQKLTAEAQPTFILYLIPPTYLTSVRKLSSLTLFSQKRILKKC
jgi:hypothetical protein